MEEIHNIVVPDDIPEHGINTEEEMDVPAPDDVSADD